MGLSGDATAAEMNVAEEVRHAFHRIVEDRSLNAQIFGARLVALAFPVGILH